MAQPVPLIDLGELTSATEEPPAPPSGRRRPGRVPRWTATLGLLALAVATLTAAAAPAGLVPVFTADLGNGSAVLDDRSLYVLTGGPQKQITAYRPGDGGLRWRRDLPSTIAAQAQPVSGAVLLTTATCQNLADSRVTRLDAATGEPGWSRQGAPFGVAPGGRVLLATWESAGLQCGGPAEIGVSVLVAVDAGTGEPAWSIRVTPDDRGAVSENEDDIRRLVLVRPDGTIVVWDTATGAQLVAVRFADLALPPAGPGTSTVPPVLPPVGLQLVGDVLMVATQAGEEVAVRGYAVDTLTERWRYRTTREVYPSAYSAAACAPLLCLLGERRTIALDPATGTVVWQRDRPMLAARDGRIIAEDPTGLWLLDGAHGRDLVGLPGWHLAPALRRGRGPVLAFRVAAGHTQLAVVDTTGGVPAGVLRVLGAVPGGLSACELRVNDLLCTTPDGRVHGWRVRR